ncbi:MAG: hypothetical protein NTY09_13385, partial [bacterium]|nr:hypothetical protein [bacterium]
QYQAYDLMGVIIGDGADTLEYNGLHVGRQGTDLWMKNADGFTRWFNPSDFTSTLIFGYAPGGIQNYAGNANLNPYKYYASGLNPNVNLWGFLTGGSNHNGLFESGDGRLMVLEFVLPTDGIGIKFGYAVVCCWEEQGQNPPGGYTPYHRDEAIAANVIVTPDIYYNEVDGSGGSLILDLDLFSWEEQPSDIKIESSVLDSIMEFDFDTYAGIGGENYSTWHVEAEAKPLTSGENHYFWVIAESQGYDYKNGLPEIPSPDDVLASFFRYDLEILSESPCGDLVPDVETINGENPVGLFASNHTGLTMEGSNFEAGDLIIEVEKHADLYATSSNVTYVDSNNLLFDIDLTGLDWDIYDVRLTNGCGEQLDDLAVGILEIYNIIPVGTPNADVTHGGVPKDLAVNPAADQTAISYNAPKFREYSDDYTTNVERDSWFNNFNNQYVQLGTLDGQPQLIWYNHESSPWYPGQYMCWSWADYDGWQSAQSQWQPQSGNIMYDIANLQGTDELWCIFNWFGLGFTFFGTKADYTYIAFYHTHLGSNNFFGGSGDEGVIPENLVAIDMAQYQGSSRDMYILEKLPSTNTAEVELWRIGYDPVFLGSFGEDFLYNALDITVDSTYNIYVLEYNSGGHPVIWAYDDSFNLIGTSGPISPEVLSGDALRIDCALSTDPDEVHVLSTESVTRFAMN